jgi:hypothetical protein
MQKHRIGDKVFIQVTAAEVETLYLFATMIVADEANRDQLDDNDIPLCLAVVARLAVPPLVGAPDCGLEELVELDFQIVSHLGPSLVRGWPQN